MTPAAETKLLALLERIAIALEKGGSGASGAGGGVPSTVEVPFGKNKGKKLGDLTDQQLKFYAFTWVPQTSAQYPKPSPRDQAFSAAAKGEAKRRGLVPDVPEGAESPANAKESPVPPPSPAPSTDSQDLDDDSVPF